MTAFSHNRVRSQALAERDTEQISGGVDVDDALFAGVTGGNSPHHTNQPRK